MTEKNSKHISIVVLAAGASSRMGQSKQLLKIEGKPLLALCVETALEAKTGRVVVVLGATSDQHEKVIENRPVEIIHNPSWQKGIGSSIRAGLRYVLEKDPTVEGVIIMVCDQPLVNADHLGKLLEAFRKTKNTVASTYSSTHGVPVLFASSAFDKLLALNDDQGAKKVIESFPYEQVEFPGGEIDLDTLQDYYEFTGGS